MTYAHPETQYFFELLYADAEDGWLVLSHPDPDPTHVNPKTGKRWLRSVWLDLARTSLARAAEIAASLSTQGTVYFGVALQRPESHPHHAHRSKPRQRILYAGAEINRLYPRCSISMSNHAV